MASLNINHVYKVYPNGHKAVNDFTMEIADKEFIVFVGPSGCGKSTMLRMIAGLEEITAGELYIGDSIVNGMEPKDRDIAMVFQNYALYPHMTIYANIAFGLKIRKVPKEVIDTKVREVAEILGITDYLFKKPKEMSGGQRQRVALGRAIVREPKVFLLDEPLSNLDAKLRTTMRSEISKLHKKLQTTFIYVTHDQVEAMTMGTRIVVMKDGFVQQIDTPRNLYSFPVNKFVAGFIGTPQMNFYKGKMSKKEDKVRITFDNTEVDVTAPSEIFDKADLRYLLEDRPICFGIRSEHISVNPKEYPYKAKCRVSYVEDLGIDSQVYADFNLSGEETITGSATKVILRAPAAWQVASGSIIEVSLDLTNMHMFDVDTEKTIMPRIPENAFSKLKITGNKLNILGTQIEVPPVLSDIDGEFDVQIPTSAISFGGQIKCNVLSEEDINGTHLVKVKADGKALFVVANKDADINSGLNIDFEQCTFSKGGEVLLKPLPKRSQLKGKIVKRKEMRENPYYLEIAGQSLRCPNDVAQRIIMGGGSKIFNADLGISFTPYDIASGESGLSATITKVLDYGKEKFVECEIDGQQVYIATDGKAGDTIMFAPDMTKISVYHLANNIRLV